MCLTSSNLDCSFDMSKVYQSRGESQGKMKEKEKSVRLFSAYEYIFLLALGNE